MKKKEVNYDFYNDPFNISPDVFCMFCINSMTIFENIKDKYQNNFQKEDERSFFLHQLRQHWFKLFIIAGLLRDNTQSIEGWKKMSFVKIEDNIDNNFVKQNNIAFQTNLTTCFMYGLFAITESSFRKFAAELAVQNIKIGRANFNKVKDVIIDKCNLDNKWKTFFIIYANIRNSMHNNGVFCPQNGKNESVIYNSKTYLFEDNKKINFAGWGFYSTLDFLDNFLFEELAKFLDELYSSPTFQNLPLIKSDLVN